ncbi:hypothetical protein GYH30_031356 [Glycine max]|nr:hypothetical protein GYH30_031356 [Glycine max]
MALQNADDGGVGAEGGLSGNVKAVRKRGHARLGGGEDARVARKGRSGDPCFRNRGSGFSSCRSLYFTASATRSLIMAVGGRGTGGGGSHSGGEGREGLEGGEGGGSPIEAAGLREEAVEGHGLAPHLQLGLEFHGGREIAK